MSRLLPLATFGLHLVALTGGVEARKFKCPPLGISLPAPKSPSSSGIVANALPKAQEWFANATGNFEGTAVSLTLKSLHEDEPLLDLHHTPSKADDRSVSEVDSNTLYRIASISKLFSPLAALQVAEINLEDPVTNYLPELLDLQEQQEDVNELTTIAWDEITVGALASHMSGFGSDMAVDISNFPLDDPAQLGLPPVDESETPGCAGLQGIPGCTKEDFFAVFGKHRPTFGPFDSPVYVSTSYAILSWVVEAATGQSFESFVQENIFDIANMTRSSSGEKPEDGTGFIPAEDPWWDGELGILNAGGGFYSSTEDLTNFGKAILNHDLLGAAETRKWLKPSEHTSSLGMSIGGPWEIMRTHELTSDGRVIDLYTKSGDLGAYKGMLVLIPDFDVTFAVLMGGPDASSAAVTLGTGQLVEILIPVLDEVAKAEAKKNFAGTYGDEETNSTVTLSVDDAPGLLITELVMRDVNVLENYALYTATQGGAPSSDKIEVTPRLYSSGLQAGSQVGFRAMFHTGSVEDDTQLEERLPFIPDVSCNAFFQLDRVNYGMNAMEDFVFSVSEDGCADELEARFWRVKLRRSEGDDGDPETETDGGTEGETE